ncbi:hypothetical protein PAXRUDRAFT_824962 [Paxillus rubicundulus Ve08.2h10]|uniref:Uncharacterized protein n=1 Tax=Paxillus rubicundulus Ve08.2h10 TaxID=930991 RepID=A0A0D0EBD3_9AGAM|nr:hypothetical protein PAXRUDRAFT_824962 [Paxillus rubicundulus Ve08.2h10]
MKIFIPDLVSCRPFDPQISRNYKLVSTEAKHWLFNGAPHLDEQFGRAVPGLEAGQFAARCHYNLGYPQCRVCTDFFHWIFHIDNLPDDMDSRGVRDVSNVVMDLLYHPQTHCSSARLNWMTKQ